MKLKTILFEAESESAKLAHKLGLTYKGHGFWGDKAGNTVAKTVNDKLVKSGPNDDAVLASAGTDWDSETSKNWHYPYHDDSQFEPYTGKDNSEKLSAEQIMAKQVGKQQGTNEGGFFQGTDKKLRYVKAYKNPTRSITENLANSFYRDLNINAPESQTFQSPNGKDQEWFASVIVPGSNLGIAGVNKTIANKILDGFCADVLLANWDAVGLDLDNIIVAAGSYEPYRIDNGASFMFRAQEANGEKPSSVLNQISEWDVFSSPKNPAYRSIFKAAGIKTADDLGPRIVKQVADILALHQKSGGWEKYVDEKAPELNAKYPTARKVMIEMLYHRTKLLVEKAKQLQGKK